jgi:membrane protein implicated in regulation of membrane protease activity
LVFSLLVALAVLLLVRELPLKLMLMLALMLVPLTVTLLELLGWVAWETGTVVAHALWSTDLALPDLHLLALPPSHDSSIDQMLKGREGMVHQLVVKGVNQTSQELVLPLGISVDILRRIAR